MYSKIIIDENSVYEIDENCVRQREEKHIHTENVEPDIKRQKKLNRRLTEYEKF